MSLLGKVPRTTKKFGSKPNCGHVFKLNYVAIHIVTQGIPMIMVIYGLKPKTATGIHACFKENELGYHYILTTYAPAVQINNNI